MRLYEWSAQNAPPPQYLMPVPVSATPMHSTQTPVTMGGNMRRSVARGTKDRPISRNAQSMHVPA